MTAHSAYYLVLRRLTEDDGRTMIVKQFTSRRDAAAWVAKQANTAIGSKAYTIVEPVKA